GPRARTHDGALTAAGVRTIARVAGRVGRACREAETGGLGAVARTTIASGVASTGSAAKTSNLMGAAARPVSRTRAASTIRWNTTETIRLESTRGRRHARGPDAVP